MSPEASHAPGAVAPQPEEMLTVAEIVPILKLHKTTVYRLIRTGAIQGASRLGRGPQRPRGVRVPRSAVMAYLHSSLIEPEVAA